jgi:hypothetical protein
MDMVALAEPPVCAARSAHRASFRLSQRSDPGLPLCSVTFLDERFGNIPE